MKKIANDKMIQAQSLYDSMEAEDKQINDDYFLNKSITHQEWQERLNALTNRYKEDLRKIFKPDQK